MNFAAIPTTILATTYYIVPSGGKPLRILGLNDNPPPPPPACVPGLPCIVLNIPGPGSSAFVPRLNAKGQMLFRLWNGLFIGSKDGTLSPVPLATSGACGIQPVTTGNSLNPLLETSAFLNNAGVVAFTESAEFRQCRNLRRVGRRRLSQHPPLLPETQHLPRVGGTMTSPIAMGFDDSGDIVFQAAISGSTLTSSALLRYHPGNAPADVVAYDCEPAPGTNGSYFTSGALPWSGSRGPSGTISLLSSSSAFGGVSIANDGRVSFNASLSNGQNAIYRQTGAAAPEFVFLDFKWNDHASSWSKWGLFCIQHFFYEQSD